MQARILLLLAAVVLAVLAGCAAKPLPFELELKVLLDGRPVKGATVTVDGVAEGSTDAKGLFVKTLTRPPEKPIKLVVQQDGKVRTKAWQKEISIKKRKEGEAVERQVLTAELQRFVIVVVTEAGQPAAGARVAVDDKDVGTTAASGELEYVFGAWPRNGLRLSAKKDGFGETAFAYQGDSGDRVAMPLYKEAVVSVEALEERYGRIRPLTGAAVSIAGRQVGATGPNGGYVYRHQGSFGETVPLRISSGAHMPGVYTYKVTLGGQHSFRQYFYPAGVEKLRTAVMGVVANTAGEDISDVVKKIESSFNDELFDGKTFRQVPTQTARDLIGRSKLSVEKIKTSNWRGSELGQAVDVVVFGSVSRGEEDSYVVEVSFYGADGKLALTQAAVAGSGGSWRVGRAVDELVSNIRAAYPIAGVVTGVSAEGVQVNLGRDQFAIGSNDVFLLESVKRNDEGRIVGEADAGTLKVRRARDPISLLQAEAVRGTSRLGDRVTRIDVSGTAAGSDRVVVAVKDAKAGALAGVNVYADQRWVGATDRKGEVSVPVRLGRKVKLIVYRHGYGQGSREIKPAKKGERYEFALKSFNTLFTIDSEPSGAAVSIDDSRVGSTPITKPQPVTLGFHTLRVDAGGDYRAFEEVIEFSGERENRTGANKVVLYKDYLAMGERAENSGQIDEAMRLYAMAPAEHPDYADLHHRLGQLYFDDKRDYDKAIAEFERVQALPEVQELVRKQYAVVYTNLGKAYYAKGEQVFRSNQTDAIQYFAKAVKALDRARENTRFFPNERHDEAVHDTYYYRALAYHNLYQATHRDALLTSVELAWNEYLDFFPAKLRGNPQYEQLRESAEVMAKQVKAK